LYLLDDLACFFSQLIILDFFAIVNYFLNGSHIFSNNAKEFSLEALFIEKFICNQCVLEISSKLISLKIVTSLIQTEYCHSLSNFLESHLKSIILGKTKLFSLSKKLYILSHLKVTLSQFDIHFLNLKLETASFAFIKSGFCQEINEIFSITSSIEVFHFVK
jgi:hypothetical protein